MLEEAVAYQPNDVFPVVVAFIRDFFLQHGTDGNHGRKRIPEYQELQEKLPAQHAQACRENNRCDSRDLDDRRKQLKQPQIWERDEAEPAVTRPKEHVPVRPTYVQQTLLPACALSSKGFQ